MMYSVPLAKTGDAWIDSSDSILARTFANSSGSLTAQSFWGASRMRDPLAPPRKSVLRNVEAEAQRLHDPYVARLARLVYHELEQHLALPPRLAGLLTANKRQ